VGQWGFFSMLAHGSRVEGQGRMGAHEEEGAEVGVVAVALPEGRDVSG